MKLLSRAKAAWGKTVLADRFLILFMVILLTYTAVGLFLGTASAAEEKAVDTIVRTSAAAIFGYFISSNFQGSAATAAASAYSSAEITSTQAGIQQMAQIGFAPSDGASTAAGKAAADSTAYTSSRLKLQILLVSAVGLFSLLLLLFTRLFTTASEPSAVIYQLRDFVSACIGFLISCGRRKV
jgi:hypothetical protein